MNKETVQHRTIGAICWKETKRKARVPLSDFRVWGHNVLATAHLIDHEVVTVIYDDEDHLWHVVPVTPLTDDI